MARNRFEQVDEVQPDAITLLLTTNATVALVGALVMLLFHLFITSTFPLAVPLEWNVFFGFIAIVLWVGFDPATYNVWSFSEPLLLVPVLALLMFGPVLGNLRPDLVSFLPSMRQYAGNWASAVWAMRAEPPRRQRAVKSRRVRCLEREV